VLSPADIARYSGVDRARVYDSLNRLIEKGFIQKEPVKRGANYQVIPIDKIFKSIREEYKKKIEETIVLENVMTEMEIDTEESEPRVWAINTKDKIRKQMRSLIDSAENRIWFILTPDLLMDELGGHEWIIKEIWNKKFSNNEIKIIVALKITDLLKESIKKLLKLDVIVQRIIGDNVLPFGLLITDNDFLFTTLDKVSEAPEYTSGLWLENGKPSQLVGYEHLFRHFISSECDRAVLTPTKKVSQSKVV
jgi:sugar-specific transcriptional regulator TrmB